MNKSLTAYIPKIKRAPHPRMRRIKGKVYHYFRLVSGKQLAKEIAKETREKGYNVIMFPTKPRGFFNLYARKKKERG